jgi:hypothetical protein
MDELTAFRERKENVPRRSGGRGTDLGPRGPKLT